MDINAINSMQYCACFRLRAAARKVTRDFEDALKAVDLRATQFTLLCMITGMKPNSMTALADEVGMDRTALNRALNIMKKHDWVTVSKSEESLEKKIRITEAGQEKIKEAFPLWKAVQEKIIGESSKEEWQEHSNWLVNIAQGRHY